MRRAGSRLRAPNNVGNAVLWSKTYLIRSSNCGRVSLDPSTTRKCPVTSDDLDVSEDALAYFEIESWQCSRPAWKPEETGSHRCVWHTETAKKPSSALSNEINDGELHGAVAAQADLSSVNLPSAPGFVDADLSGAFLHDADLEEASLGDADLTGAFLRDADLPKADLQGADLPEADLRGATLSKADLRGTTLSDLRANQRTTVGKLCPGLSKGHQYYTLAQAYHELKKELSQEGLSQRARRAWRLERQARTAESWARFKRYCGVRARQLRTGAGWRRFLRRPYPRHETRRQFLTAVGGVLSRGLTGYGTRPLFVLLWSAAIVLGTTGLLRFGPAPPDTWRGGPLYYSVVTFVTAPPHPPRQVGIGIRAAIVIETYLGTALIVLFGYVLGTRDRV